MMMRLQETLANIHSNRTLVVSSTAIGYNLGTLRVCNVQG